MQISTSTAFLLMNNLFCQFYVSKRTEHLLTLLPFTALNRMAIKTNKKNR